MNRVSSMTELVELSMKELSEILQNEANARKLHTFLHTKHSPEKQTTTKQTSSSKMLANAAAKLMFKGKKR